MVIPYFPDCRRRATWGWFVAESVWYASEKSMRAAYPPGTVFQMILDTQPTFCDRRKDPM